MAARARTPRRTDALSKAVIVEAAIAILDAEGEDGLTFRALTTRLSTGYGAIYYRVSNRGELLAAATDEVVARALTEVPHPDDPREALRAVALGLFDVLAANPWSAAQVSREPWRLALLGVYERVSAPLQALGVPDEALFDTSGVLVGYILGVAVQSAAQAGAHADRSELLAALAARWRDLDPTEHPAAHRAAGRLNKHDDRSQFVAGVDLIVAGIETVHGTSSLRPTGPEA